MLIVRNRNNNSSFVWLTLSLLFVLLSCIHTIQHFFCFGSVDYSNQQNINTQFVIAFSLYPKTATNTIYSKKYHHYQQQYQQQTVRQRNDTNRGNSSRNIVALLLSGKRNFIFNDDEHNKNQRRQKHSKMKRQIIHSRNEKKENDKYDLSVQMVTKEIGETNEKQQTSEENIPITTMNHNINSIVTNIVIMIGSTTSVVVSTIFFVSFLYKRDTVMALFFTGAVLNAILSKVLKKVIKQSRPNIQVQLQPQAQVQIPVVSTSNEQNNEPSSTTSLVSTVSSVLFEKKKPSDGGMPSSHAMSLSFIGTFTCLYLSYQQYSLIIPTILLIVSYSCISLYYRVKIKCLHTWEQVIVGTIIGTTNAYLWYSYGCCDQPNQSILLFLRSLIETYVVDPTTKLIPYKFLTIPLAIGAATVSSIERKLVSIMKHILGRQTKRE